MPQPLLRVSLGFDDATAARVEPVGRSDEVGGELLVVVEVDLRQPEGCANSVSCGDVVFVDEAAEPVAALDGGGW